MHPRKMTSPFDRTRDFSIWVMILVGVFAFCLSSVSAYQCYQETANVSTACGGLGTGYYNFSSIDNSHGTFNTTYTVPFGATSAILDVKFGRLASGDGIRTNFTLPDSCVGPFLTNLSIFYEMDNAMGPSINISCLNITKDLVLLNRSIIISSGSPSTDDPNMRWFDGNWSTGIYYSVKEMRSLGTVVSASVLYEDAIIWEISDSAIEQLSHTDVGEAFETENVKFTLNESFNWTVYPITSAKLFLNTTPYIASYIRTSFGAEYSVSIDLPSVTATKSIPYYWELTFVNGTTETVVWEKRDFKIPGGLVARYNVTVDDYDLVQSEDNCLASGYTSIARFHAFDEVLLTRIKPYSFSGDFKFWLGSGTTYINFSIDYPNTNNVTICDPDPVGAAALGPFFMDADIQYSDVNATLYNPRNYYFDNQSLLELSNPNFVSEAIYNLYLLNKTSSTSFIEIVYDENNIPLENVLINTYRYYQSDGVYRLVEISKTDTGGTTVGQFETETPEYKFVLVKDTRTLLTTVNQKIVPTAIPYTLTFFIGQGLTAPWAQYLNKSGFTYIGPTFDNETGLITFSYTDTSNVTNYVRMVVSNMNFTSDNNIVCDVNSTLTAAMLTCNVSGMTDTLQVSIFLSRSPETPIITSIIILYHALRDAMGRMGYFMGWLIILTGFCVALYNPTVGIVTGNVACWFVWSVGLISFGLIWLFGLAALSIWVIVELQT